MTATMDDEDYAKLADETAARLRQAADRNDELKAIIAESDVVFGLYFDPESMSRWDKYLIKGEANSQSTRIACIWCKAIDEALALSGSRSLVRANDLYSHGGDRRSGASRTMRPMSSTSCSGHPSRRPAFALPPSRFGAAGRATARLLRMRQSLRRRDATLFALLPHTAGRLRKARV